MTQQGNETSRLEYLSTRIRLYRKAEREKLYIASFSGLTDTEIISKLRLELDELKNSIQDRANRKALLDNENQKLSVQEKRKRDEEYFKQAKQKVTEKKNEWDAAKKDLEDAKVRKSESKLEEEKIDILIEELKQETVFYTDNLNNNNNNSPKRIIPDDLFNDPDN